MGDKIPRRAFLKTAPLAAGILANAAPYSAPIKASDVPISGTPYDPVSDYPMRAKRHAEVILRDAFWRPRVDLNARVTIPAWAISATVAKPGTSTTGPRLRHPRIWPAISTSRTSAATTTMTRISRGVFARYGHFSSIPAKRRRVRRPERSVRKRRPHLRVDRRPLGEWSPS
jgi:hypothetical protein